jgi:hypothetical protein
LNEICFPSLNNLKFSAGDVWENLDKIETDQTMLVHCRTGTLLPFPHLCEFYKRIAAKNIPTIGIAEHLRFDINTGRFTNQDDNEFTSIPKTHTGLTNLHDYKEALGRAGYQIVSKTRTPDISYRVVNQLALGEYVYIAFAELS